MFSPDGFGLAPDGGGYGALPPQQGFFAFPAVKVEYGAELAPAEPKPWYPEPQLGLAGPPPPPPGPQLLEGRRAAKEEPAPEAERPAGSPDAKGTPPPCCAPPWAAPFWPAPACGSPVPSQPFPGLGVFPGPRALYPGALHQGAAALSGLGSSSASSSSSGAASEGGHSSDSGDEVSARPRRALRCGEPRAPPAPAPALSRQRWLVPAKTACAPGSPTLCWPVPHEHLAAPAWPCEAALSSRP